MSTEEKLSNRTDYRKAKGYEVMVKVVYTRARKVRALSPEQAAEFAKRREEVYAPRYFTTQNHRHFALQEVEILDVDEL